MAWTKAHLAKLVLFDGSTQHEITEAQNMTIAFNVQEPDITAFSSEWDQIIQTTKGAEVTFDGGCDLSGGTNTWAQLWAAFLNGEKLSGTNVFNDSAAELRAYVSASYYFAMDGYTTFSNVGAAVKDVIKANVRFKADGAVTLETDGS